MTKPTRRRPPARRTVSSVTRNVGSLRGAVKRGVGGGQTRTRVVKKGPRKPRRR